MAKFDFKKHLMQRLFGAYINAVPNVRLNRLKKSRAVVGDTRLREVFKIILKLVQLMQQYRTLD